MPPGHRPGASPYDSSDNRITPFLAVPCGPGTELLFPGAGGCIVRVPSPDGCPPAIPGPAPVAVPIVLLVDPHEDSRLIYAACFRHHGVSVAAHECCAAAVEAARTSQPALIVLALSFASGPGWSALRALKSDPATARIPILAVSTTGLAEHRDRALSLGCAGFYVKPLPPLDLLHAARAVLNDATAA